ncbi:MAG: hypothetical protein KDA63_00835, partial [Planctomycetales bacterium]|nr:hypothetical protein [Planctomycetales bacterium]
MTYVSPPNDSSRLSPPSTLSGAVAVPWSALGSGLAWVAAPATTVWAASADPVDSARDALSHGNRPWYSADTDSTERIELRQPFLFPVRPHLGGTRFPSTALSPLPLASVLLIAAV